MDKARKPLWINGEVSWPLPAPVSPLLQVRPFVAERCVLAVTRVDPRAVRQRPEHPLLKVVHELAETGRVALRVAWPAREQAVAGEQMRGLGKLTCRVVTQRDAARSVAAQVDDTEHRVTDADLVTAGDWFRYLDGQRRRVGGIGCYRRGRGLLDLAQRLPVVLVAVGGDDPGELRAADERDSLPASLAAWIGSPSPSPRIAAGTRCCRRGPRRPSSR